MKTTQKGTANQNGAVSIIDAMKLLLPDPGSKIKLDDLVTGRLKLFLKEIDLSSFPVQGAPVSTEEFLKRIERYEELSKELQVIVALLAYWGEKEQLALLEKTIRRVAETDRGSSGTVVWLKLGWYPLMLLMYSAGISALARKKFDVLTIVLETSVRVSNKFDGKAVPAVIPVGSYLSDLQDSFKLLPGKERNYVPRSEHLRELLQPTLEDLFFLGQSFEELFDYFEILLALVYADRTGRDWGPLGRFAWKYGSMVYGDNPFSDLLEVAKKESDSWGPIAAGLFGRSYKRFEEIVGPFQKMLDGLHWR